MRYELDSGGCFINNIQGNSTFNSHCYICEASDQRLARQLESKRQGNKTHVMPFRASAPPSLPCQLKDGTK
jgi:hypothetical protein